MRCQCKNKGKANCHPIDLRPSLTRFIVLLISVVSDLVHLMVLVSVCSDVLLTYGSIWSVLSRALFVFWEAYHMGPYLVHCLYFGNRSYITHQALPFSLSFHFFCLLFELEQMRGPR